MKDLLKIPGVQAIGTGYKAVGNEQSDHLCRVFSVEKKLPRSMLKPKHVIPHSLPDGHITDVIQTGIIRALDVNVGRQRPCPPGFSIGHLGITAGTLGVYAKDMQDGKVVAISNNHVIANSNDAIVGDTIVQPGPHDGGVSPKDDFGILKRFIPVEFTTGLDPDCEVADKVCKFLNLWTDIGLFHHRFSIEKVNYAASNLVDAAIMSVDPKNVDLEVPYIGFPTGSTELALGDQVHKSGRTTGYTTGFVSQVDVTVNVQYGEGKIAQFTDQIAIDGDFSAGGDSGSGIFIDQLFGGLLFAGGEGITIANRAANVLRLLEVSINE